MTLIILFYRTCPPERVQFGTVSLTTAVSFDEEDDDDNASSVILFEFDDTKELLSLICLKFPSIETFIVDDDEHFCRLFICFKS